MDGVFNLFIRRQDRREPFFAQYCNGTTSICDGLSQWGSFDLAHKGYTPMQILKYYYPSDIVLVESNNFTAGVETFSGTALREGCSGEDVLTMQNYLNRISIGYPALPQISDPNGYFGSSTKNSVMIFQQIFNLIGDGIIGKKTWYQITTIYVVVKRLAELGSEGELPKFPSILLRVGSRGDDVRLMQSYLNAISKVFPSIPTLVADGIFGTGTQIAVMAFQDLFNLTDDGIIGRITWDKIVSLYHNLPNIAAPQFPGTALRVGSRGDDVILMQKYLSFISQSYHSIPNLIVDGIFGPGMQASVIAFQKQFGLTADGVIGNNSWNKIVSIYNILNLPTINISGANMSVLNMSTTKPSIESNLPIENSPSIENSLSKGNLRNSPPKIDNYGLMMAYLMMNR